MYWKIFWKRNLISRRISVNVFLNLIYHIWRSDWIIWEEISTGEYIFFMLLLYKYKCLRTKFTENSWILGQSRPRFRCFTCTSRLPHEPDLFCLTKKFLYNILNITSLIIGLIFINRTLKLLLNSNSLSFLANGFMQASELTWCDLLCTCPRTTQFMLFFRSSVIFFGSFV